MDHTRYHCINCGIGTWRSNTIGMNTLEDQDILSVIQEWAAPLEVNSSHHICQACHKLAVKSLSSEEHTETVGHREVCINCGRSVLHLRTAHVLRSDTERENRIQQVIHEWVSPRSIPSAKVKICHGCWMRADRNAQKPMSILSESTGLFHENVEQDTPPSTPSPPRHSDSIVLPDYVRPAETESRCFILGCLRKERNRVPLSIRKMLLNNYNFYVPTNNRLCSHHLKAESWDFLTGDIYSNVFTAIHIQDMLEIKGQSMD